MRKKHIYVGMDVHKETNVIALAHGGRGGKVENFGTYASSMDSMKIALTRLRRKKAQLHFVYESGPTGFVLQRRLLAWGEDCIIVSASHVPKKAGDRVKTDRRDAIQLAKMHRSGDLDAIHVPDSADEAIRDLCRARFDAKQDERRSKQRLKSFLLRNGYNYQGNANWTPSHKSYIREKQMQHPAQKSALESYMQSIDQCGDRIEDLETQLQILGLDWKLYPLVEALMVLKGVAWLTATNLVAELGDMRRFPKARNMMAYLGLTPSEHSTGTSIRKGAITKAGNSHARFFLVESAQHYFRRPNVSKALTERQIGADEKLKALSWKAQNRLHKRYWTLASRTLTTQKIQIAIARELVGFVWAIGQMDYLYEDLEAA